MAHVFDTFAKEEAESMCAAFEVEPGTVIHFLPQGICSWNYWLKHAEITWSLELNSAFRRHGKIKFAGDCLEVKRSGIMISSYAGFVAGEEVIGGVSHLFSSKVTIEDLYGDWTLVRDSMFGRGMSIRRDYGTYALIRPMHWGTRRATIEVLRSELSLWTVAFCFWIAAHRWRMEAQSS